MRGVTVIAITVAQLGTWQASARPSPPDPYDGAWTLTPAYSTTCSAGAVSVGITVGRMATHRIAPDSLAITSDVAVSGAGTTFLALYTLKTGLDSTTGEFRFAGPVAGSAQRRGVTGTVHGRVDVRGAFDGNDAIVAQVKTTLAVDVQLRGTVSRGSCTPFNATIRATRVES